MDEQLRKPTIVKEPKIPKGKKPPKIKPSGLDKEILRRLEEQRKAEVKEVAAWLLVILLAVVVILFIWGMFLGFIQ